LLDGLSESTLMIVEDVVVQHRFSLVAGLPLLLGLTVFSKYYDFYQTLTVG